MKIDKNTKKGREMCPAPFMGKCLETRKDELTLTLLLRSLFLSAFLEFDEQQSYARPYELADADDQRHEDAGAG